MKLRFVYSFGDIDKKSLKKEKGLNKKYKYSLKEAEAVVTRVQQKIDKPISITLNCTDTEEGSLYGFDNIVIKPLSNGSEATSLLSEIENQILEAGASVINNPDGLISSISLQYDQEDSPVVENTKPKETKKKGLISLPILKKKNKKASVPEVIEEDEDEIPYYEDSPEIVEEDEADESHDSEDSEVVEEEERDQEEQDQEDYGFHDDDDDDEEDNESNSTNNEVAVTNTMTMPINTNAVAQAATQQSYLPGFAAQTNIVQMKKYESVSLPKFEEYIQIGEEVDSIVKTMEEKLDPESLFKYTHFSPVSISNTKLDQYRQSYIRKCLNEPKFELLREHYWTTVRAITGDGSDRLKDAYDRAAYAEYENIAKANVNQTILEIENEAEETYREFVEKQETIVSEKELKKRQENEAAIKAFIAEKEAELAMFISNERERASNLMEDRKEAIYSEMKLKKTELIEEEWYNVKADYNRNLIDGKRLVIRKIIEEIQSANENVWQNAQKYIDVICTKVDDKMPEFAADIEKFNSLEKQQHDISVDMKKIQIEETKAHAEQLKAEQDLEKQRELEHENKMLKMRLETEKQKFEILEERQKTIEQTKNSRSFGFPILSR